MDVFPTSLSRRNLFRAGLAAAAVSITAGCRLPEAGGGRFQRSQPRRPGGPQARHRIRHPEPRPTQNRFLGNEFGYAELLLRPQPDGNPTDWLLKDAVNESDRTWRLSLKEGITFQTATRWALTSWRPS